MTQKVNYFARKLKNISILIFLIVVSVILILSPSMTNKSVKLGMNYCFNLLIPSLFPFMFTSSFIVIIAMNMDCNKTINKITKFLFFLPGYTLPLILLSLIGGYPVGAKCAKILFDNKKITVKQLNFIMCFCVNSGPAFIITILGDQILNNRFMGLIIFLIQVILAILIGIFVGLKERITDKNFYFENNFSENKKEDSISESFVISAKLVSESLIEMCALIVIFSVCIGILNDMGFFKIIGDFLFKKFEFSVLDSGTFLISFLEITSACVQTIGYNVSPIILAFSVGFGGLCAHLQIASILKGSDFNFRKFLFFRLINGILTSFTFYIFLISNENTQRVFSTISKNITLIKSNALTIHGSISLFLLCMYFLVFVNLKTRNKIKK